MNIDREFIHGIVNNFHDSILNDGKLCAYANTSPTNGNYDDSTYQKIYALRYIPAYYFEYCILADELRSRLQKNDQQDVNIASFGCGLYPDYYALCHNMDGIVFQYVGYDICSWETRRHLPGNEGNIYLSNISVDKINQSEINSYDVFIFPKSLGDIATNANIDSLAQKIANTKKNKIYFLNSFISIEHKKNSQHITIFEVFDRLLNQNKFKCTDNYEDTYFNYNSDDKSRHQGLKGINWNFDYPDGVLPLCDDNCKIACNANKYPVFTNQFMNYQILEYTR
ncbi:hypothetical protein [Kosakonia sacchari]